MSKISDQFKKGKVFVGYLTGGDGGVDYCIDACFALIKGGVNLLEIGMPFTDPVADGPVIQAAMQRSLSQKSTPQTLLTMIKKIRQKTDVPIVLFSYYNPLLQAGAEYLSQLKAEGADGVLVVDLPLEEAKEHLQATRLAGLDPIWIATPATSIQRLERLATISQGFVYYACQKGTTGVRNHLPEDFEKKLHTIKSVIKMPVAAGFGISTRESAKAALNCIEGFVVGSAFVECMATRPPPEELTALAKAIDPR
jgi:tryptophan synthase alpha chain